MNNKITGVVALVLVFVSMTVKAQNVDKEIEAVTAAEDWLALVDTSFQNKKSAVETITPMKEKDGKWRVSGYYIKKGQKPDKVTLNVVINGTGTVWVDDIVLSKESL